MAMPTLQQIIGTITGKVAFERTQANFTTIKDAHNGLETNLETHKADNVSPHPIYAKKTQEDWISATLQNGWIGNTEYRKDNFGMVTIRGGINTIGTTTPDTSVCIVPSGYLPAYNLPVCVRKGNVSPYDSSFWFFVDINGLLKTGYNQTFPSTGTTNANVFFEISYIAV